MITSHLATLTFQEEPHRYLLDGEPVLSVTQLLRAVGLVDFSHIPAPILTAAQERGRVVHRAIHYFNERDLDVAGFRSDFPDYAGYLDAWQSFCDQRRFSPVLCEHRIASRRLLIAGTLDCLGTLDGRPVLLDFATGDPADAAKDLQTAGYHVLALEWQHHDPALQAFFTSHGAALKRYAVALRADGSFSIEHYGNVTDARQFITLVEAHRIVTARQRIAKVA